jgi:signal transduction histidine kinase
LNQTWQNLLSELTKIIEQPSNGLNAQSAVNARNVITQLGTSFQEIVTNAQIAEKRIRTLINVMPLGLLVCSQNDKVEAVNPNALDLFRCTQTEQMRGVTLGQLFSLEGAPYSTSKHLVDSANSTKTEVIARTFDGQTFPGDIVVCQFSSIGPTRLLVLVEDITPVKEIERLKEEFVAMLSHDLRTPLTSLRVFVDLISSGRFDSNLQELKGKARSMEQEADRLLQMINSLLDVHKLESHGLEMFVDVTPCSEIVRQSIQAIDSLVETKNIALTIGEFDKDLHVNCDLPYTVQVLINLLGNSLKFSPAGTSVSLGLEPEDGFVKFKISDRGPGIPEDLQQKIFNRFEQVDALGDRRRGGSGLGLAISKGIIEQEGGRIGVESRDGGGSVFWFTLPRVELGL